jgi:lipopolysaccharide export system protein LptA
MALALSGIFFIFIAFPVLAYDIDADHLEVFNREGRAVFTGNVKVSDEHGEISANRMEVYYVIAGDTIKHIEAYGQVEIIRENIVGRGQRAQYDVRADTVVLDGEAFLEDPRGKFFADTIWLDLSAEKLRMHGNIEGVLRRREESG